MMPAQRVFVATAWLFIVLAGLLFLVPTTFASVQAAAWVCLGAGILSHIVLLGAIVFEVIRPEPDIPPTDG